MHTFMVSWKTVAGELFSVAVQEIISAPMLPGQSYFFIIHKCICNRRRSAAPVCLLWLAL